MSTGEEWCDCYRSCLVITARFITREWGGESREKLGEKVSYLVWGCKSGFWRERTRSEGDRDRSLYPLLPSLECCAIWSLLCFLTSTPILSSSPLAVFYFSNMFFKCSCVLVRLSTRGAILHVSSITCNQCRDEVLIWYEMKVHPVTPTTSLPVFVACESVGVLGCSQRCVGGRHDSVGISERVYVCFCLCWDNIVPEYVKKLCSHWQTTSCLFSEWITHVNRHTLLWSDFLVELKTWWSCFCPQPLSSLA